MKKNSRLKSNIIATLLGGTMVLGKFNPAVVALEDIVVNQVPVVIASEMPLVTAVPEEVKPYVPSINYVEDPRLARLKAQQRGEKFVEEGLTSWLTRSSAYQDIIDRAAFETGLSPELITALGAYESRWDPRAKSPSGPKGLKQLSRDTAIGLNLHVGTDFDQRYSPEEAIFAGARYLRQQIDRFDGDTRKALIYGYHTVENLPDFMTVEDVENYADNILSLERDLQMDKIDYPRAKLFSEYLAKTEQREVKPKETLSSIASELGVSRRTLEYVNPEIPNYDNLKNGIKIRVPKSEYKLEFVLQ